MQDAYAPRVVVTKRATDGTAISSASSPNFVAAMLEQFGARPGHHIREIGAGTGINAALLAELAGPGGHVTTIARSIRLAGEVTLSLDATDPAGEEELTKAFSYPACQQWTGITVGDREPAGHLDLWLLTAGCRFAQLSAGSLARDSGLADPALRWAGATVHDGATIAYLAARPAEWAIRTRAHRTRPPQRATRGRHRRAASPVKQ